MSLASAVIGNTAASSQSVPPPPHQQVHPHTSYHQHIQHLQHVQPASIQQQDPAMSSASKDPASMNTAYHQNNNTPSTPLVAQGDWTKNLVHLAKTAELKKHALTLQLHTAHILSSHGTLEAKNKALQDIKEQKNRLESERMRLLNCLRQVNEDRDKTDLMESTLSKECSELRGKIQTITDGEYSAARRLVDALRTELGQPPLPSLQETIEEKASAYLTERRLNGENKPGESSWSIKRTSDGLAVGSSPSITAVGSGSGGGGGSSVSAMGGMGGIMGMMPAVEASPVGTPTKRPRGRPKGSKNKTPKTTPGGAGSSAGAGAQAGGVGGGQTGAGVPTTG